MGTVESDGTLFLTVLAVSEPRVVGSDTLSVPTNDDSDSHVTAEVWRPRRALPLQVRPRNLQQSTRITRRVEVQRTALEIMLHDQLRRQPTESAG
jgi:hypothetical protein